MVAAARREARAVNGWGWPRSNGSRRGQRPGGRGPVSGDPDVGQVEDQEANTSWMAPWRRCSRVGQQPVDGVTV